jgi:hypothetical protein
VAPPPDPLILDQTFAGSSDLSTSARLPIFRCPPERSILLQVGGAAANGLGAYHGSIQSGNQTIYYAVGVYSDNSGGQTNGIPVFDVPWKNVVATFYHELNEARTDPDVEAVINGAPSSQLGWTSRQGEECGDFPVFEANPLTLVFQEVAPPSGGTAPVQFQYSNSVHGPEGPTSKPDPAAKGKARHKKHG